MSEVEKMYDNVNIKICKRKQGFTLKDCTDRDCKECGYYNMPPFTAEKQLSLIKWLSNFWVHINKVNEQFNISTGGGYVSYYAEDLADAIALYINSKWNNLTEQERTEIAEILKG